MRFVAIEFDAGSDNTHKLGYLKIPENFNSTWSIGFRDYLRDKYKVSGTVEIYPLNKHFTSDTMGKAPDGYTNMEDDFNLAIRSLKYYPSSDENDNTRRAWSMLDSVSPDFVMKER